MSGPVRLLVVDGSRLMAWLVGAVAQEPVTVEHVDSFEEAREILERRPPDAAMFVLTPMRLPWHELAALCRSHVPPIPFRCYCAVCVGNGQADGGGSSCPHVVDKPTTHEQVKVEVESLVRQALEAATNPDAGITPCYLTCPGFEH